MDIMSVKEAAKRWNLSERWVQKLCEEGRIEGVQRFGRSWMIPKTATKPNDLRRKGGDSHVQPQLETFIRVADAGSFNKAGRRIIHFPPAVIKQINLLEAQLGLTLFVRTHRGLKLTEAGKSLYQDAKYVIGYCRESVERARAADAKGRKCDPHRHLPNDPSPKHGGLMAKVSGVLSRYKVSDDSV